MFQTVLTLMLGTNSLFNFHHLLPFSTTALTGTHPDLLIIFKMFKILSLNFVRIAQYEVEFTNYTEELMDRCYTLLLALLWTAILDMR